MELRTPGEVDAMHAAGQVVARALAAARAHARVGITLRELDAVAAEVIRDASAEPLFLDYHPSWAPTPFPATICASVNDAVVHGIPGDHVLADGDLVSIDCGARLDGWCGDAAISFITGTASEADTKLIDTTARSLEAGIAAATVGNRTGDIANAIGRKARRGGYGLLDGHGGHGIGRTMHETPPFVPNEGRKRTGLRLRPGTVIAIEPMLIGGGDDAYVTADDGWTLCTYDGSRAAHIEHTVAVTADGPRVLTALPG